MMDNQTTTLANAMTEAERKEHNQKCRAIAGAENVSLIEKVRQYAALKPAGFNADTMIQETGMVSHRAAIIKALSTLDRNGFVTIRTRATRPFTYQIRTGDEPQTKSRKNTNKIPKCHESPLMDELSGKLIEHNILTAHVQDMIRTLTNLGYTVKRNH